MPRSISRTEQNSRRVPSSFARCHANRRSNRNFRFDSPFRPDDYTKQHTAARIVARLGPRPAWRRGRSVRCLTAVQAARYCFSAVLPENVIRDDVQAGFRASNGFGRESSRNRVVGSGLEIGIRELTTLRLTFTPSTTPSTDPSCGESFT